MSFFSKAKGLSLLLIGAAGGAAVSYFLDPDRGRSRRAQASDQIAAAIRDQADEARKELDYRAGQVKGAVAERATDLAGPKDLDDRTIKDKVESEVLGRAEFPKGAVVVSVADGIVTLRGTVGNVELRTQIEEATREIPEVRGVDNQLHLPGQPAPSTTT